jgi:hypothetical protein
MRQSYHQMPGSAERIYRQRTSKKIKQAMRYAPK